METATRGFGRRDIALRVARAYGQVAVALGLPFAALEVWLGQWVSAGFILATAALAATAVPVYRRTGSLEGAGHQVAAALWLSLATLATGAGGLAAPAAPWLPLAAVMALGVGGWRAGGVWTVVVLLTQAALVVAPTRRVVLDEHLPLLYAASGLGLTAALVGLSVIYQREQDALIRRHAAHVDALVSANRAKSPFLANMSHELRTPLNAILGYSEMVDEAIGERGGDPEMQADLARVGKAGRHLLALIDDLLDLSRIEVGRLTLDLAPTPLHDQVGEVLERLRPLAESSGTTVVGELEPAIAWCDRLRAVQICTNLVHNALKFAAGGKVVVGCGARDGRAWVTVTDDGPGLAADDLERVFDEFQQAHPSVRARHGGTGLGLAISRKLANAMGGRLTVTSAPGRGACFRLELPAKRPV